MQITVIGEIFKDLIFPFQGKPHSGMGGILYNLLALAQFADKDTKLYPVSHLSSEDKPTVEQLVSNYPAIDLKGLLISEDAITSQAILKYDSTGARTEVIKIPNPPVNYRAIKPFLNSNGILLNFTARRDISLETLKKLRHNSNAIIMADLHNLATRLDKEGKRRPSHLSHRKDWLQGFNIIQGNELEYANLFKDEADTPETILPHALQEGPSVAIMTLGDKGAACAWKENQKLQFYSVPGIPLAETKDPTGCGDVFAASFFWHYLHHKSPLEAANFANQAAAINSTLSSTTELSSLASFL
jgi:sugar/nucleoside kinase (ribokinase family)